MALTLAVASPVSAHALGAECRLRGNKVELEAYFDDDTPAQNAKVTVTDAQKHLVAEGRTDERGRWTFPVPKPGDYQVLVEAGAGHSARVKMTVPVVTSPREEGRNLETPARGENAEGIPISEGPSRQEFIRFPWARVALGLGIIGMAGLAVWFVLHRRRVSGRAKAV